MKCIKKKPTIDRKKKGQIEGSWKIPILSRGCFKSLYPIDDATTINNISDENELMRVAVYIPVYDKYTLSIDTLWSTSDINSIITAWGGLFSAVFPCHEGCYSLLLHWYYYYYYYYYYRR
jgi:hypothetical protein